MSVFANDTHKLVIVPNGATLSSSERLTASDGIIKALIGAGVINGYVGSSAPDPATYDWWLDNSTDPGVLKRYSNGSWAQSSYEPATGFSGLRYRFSTSTTMADPTGGYFRFNNATLASVTAVAIDDSDAGSPASDLSAFITSWEAGGVFVIEEVGAKQNFAIFQVSSVTDNSGWTQIAVSHVASSGAFNADALFSILYTPAGSGSGDMLASVYDPGSVGGDAFDMDNMAEGADTKIMTAAERTKLSGIEDAADVTDAVNIASSIHGATEKSSPVSADEFGIIDTEASNALKRLTLANLKSTILAGPIPLTSGQIAFPATQNASADANTLDDYEEGSWTPVIEGSTTPGSHTYTYQFGRYTKIGNVVHCWGFVTIGTLDGSIAGTYAYVTGLPFAHENITNFKKGGLVAEHGSILNSRRVTSVLITAGSSFLYLLYGANTTSGYMAPGDLQSGSSLVFSISYRV